MALAVPVARGAVAGRPGFRRRGGRRAGHARAGARSSSARSTGTWPCRRSRTRSRPSTRAAEAFPELDLTRVGIRGWSFGGYLAALAVLARPDVFHAAVAGAPVTDWRWYDTYYTERFLGRPQDDPSVYERNSLTASGPQSLPAASARARAGRRQRLRRPHPVVVGRACWPPAGPIRSCPCPA